MATSSGHHRPDGARATIALVCRGDTRQPTPAPGETRLRRIFEEFEALGARAEPTVYSEEAAASVRERLLQMDGVLVWVDPIVGGRERSQLDELLREAAARGVFVSTHPDTIQKMGTKRILYDTRAMPWGTAAHLCRDRAALSAGLAELLRSAGPQVVKQDRGSSGKGVWRIELIRDATPFEEATVRTQGGERGGIAEDIAFGAFIERRAPYFQAFGGTGCFVVQPYAERLSEGMIRSYMVHDRVAGFGHQLVTALTPAKPGEAAPDPPPRYYFGPGKTEFQRLRELLESGWIAQMQGRLDIGTASLPVIWDADFLLGPKDADGEDSYILCEVNVSGVFPIPDETIRPLAQATLDRIRAIRQGAGA